MSRKTVIHTWVQACIDTPPESFWGIGDLIRGVCTSYIASRNLDVDFIVDFSNHPVSKYLFTQTHKFTELVAEKRNAIEWINCASYSHLQYELCKRLKTQDTVLFLTNGPVTPGIYTNGPVTTEIYDDDCKDFVRTLLRPNSELQAFINSVAIESRYSIIHFRLGDANLVYNKKLSTEKEYEIFLNNVEPDSILMSDSADFKRDIKSKVPDSKMFDLEIGHFGLASDEKIRNTLFELFILTKARLIKTYTRYKHTSGFAVIAYSIYDVPLISFESGPPCE